MIHSCGRDHGSDHIAILACEARETIVDATKMTCAVMIAPDGPGEPKLSFFGNTAGAAHLVHAFLEFATRQKRPTDCVTCIEAYDRMRQALAIMDELPPRC